MEEYRELTFDGVLAAMQALLGKKVVVDIETGGGSSLLNVVGVLAADYGMTEPFDEREFDFAIGDSGALTLDRSRFHGASTDEDGGIHANMGDPGDSLVLRVELFRPPS